MNPARRFIADDICGKRPERIERFPEVPKDRSLAVAFLGNKGFGLHELLAAAVVPAAGQDAGDDQAARREAPASLMIRPISDSSRSGSFAPSNPTTAWPGQSLRRPFGYPLALVSRLGVFATGVGCQKPPARASTIGHGFENQGVRARAVHAVIKAR